MACVERASGGWSGTRSKVKVVVSRTHNPSSQVSAQRWSESFGASRSMRGDLSFIGNSWEEKLSPSKTSAPFREALLYTSPAV